MKSALFSIAIAFAICATTFMLLSNVASAKARTAAVETIFVHIACTGNTTCGARGSNNPAIPGVCVTPPDPCKVIAGNASGITTCGCQNSPTNTSVCFCKGS